MGQFKLFERTEKKEKSKQQKQIYSFYSINSNLWLTIFITNWHVFQLTSCICSLNRIQHSNNERENTSFEVNYSYFFSPVNYGISHNNHKINRHSLKPAHGIHALHYMLPFFFSNCIAHISHSKPLWRSIHLRILKKRPEIKAPFGALLTVKNEK